MEKKDLPKEPVRHIDIRSFDSGKIIEAMTDTSFAARDTSDAVETPKNMINAPECIIRLDPAERTLMGQSGDGIRADFLYGSGGVLPLILSVSDANHQRGWESRSQRKWAKIFE